MHRPPPHVPTTPAHDALQYDLTYYVPTQAPPLDCLALWLGRSNSAHYAYFLGLRVPANPQPHHQRAAILPLKYDAIARQFLCALKLEDEIANNVIVP